MIEGGRAACLDAARTQTVHEIAHLQAFPDVVLRIKLAARIECMRAALDDAEAIAMSAVITRSPGATRFTISSSATSNPPGTCRIRMKGERGIPSPTVGDERHRNLGVAPPRDKECP